MDLRKIWWASERWNGHRERGTSKQGWGTLPLSTGGDRAHLTTLPNLPINLRNPPYFPRFLESKMCRFSWASFVSVCVICKCCRICNKIWLFAYLHFYYLRQLLKWRCWFDWIFARSVKIEGGLLCVAIINIVRNIRNEPQIQKWASRRPHSLSIRRNQFWFFWWSGMRLRLRRLMNPIQSKGIHVSSLSPLWKSNEMLIRG